MTADKAKVKRKASASGASVLYRNFNFVVFLVFLTMIYIANGHQSEKKIREIHRLKDEVKELRSEYIFLKSEIMFNSTPSQMARGVDGMEVTAKDGLPRRLKAEAEVRRYGQ